VTWAAALGAAMFALPAAALADTTLGAEYGQDSLDNGTRDWRNTALTLVTGGRGSTLDLEWRTVERSGFHDDQWVAGGHTPLGKDFGLGIEFAGSSHPDLLPELGMRLDLDFQLPQGLVGHAGVRRSDYPQDTANAFSGGVEWYFASERLSYTLVNARLDSGGSGTVHVLEFDHYYGEDNRVGLIGASGQEATRIDPTLVVLSDVTTVALVGRHWLGASWGLGYDLHWVDQGDFYTRKGGTLGLLFRF
jgi:YaiO family outer membrane protein